MVNFLAPREKWPGRFSPHFVSILRTRGNAEFSAEYLNRVNCDVGGEQNKRDTRQEASIFGDFTLIRDIFHVYVIRIYILRVNSDASVYKTLIIPMRVIHRQHT